MPEALQTPSDLAEEVRIAKMKLSGLRDPAISALLPGANRVATEVSALLDKLLAECHG